jgi:hypothetical protein
MDGVLKYEGVTFIVEAVRAMSRSEFVKAHVDAFWLDRDESTRKKMLGRVYGLIAGTESNEE